MGNISEKLDEIISTEENTIELYNIFKSINDVDSPIIRYVIPKNSAIIRQRINEKDIEFHNISDLNYPPALNILNYGRANLPFQSIFYGCIFPSDQDAPNPRIITLMETSQFFRDTKASGIERCTCSKWELKEDLKLLAFPFHESYSSPCKDILETQKYLIDNTLRQEISLDAHEIIEYMSKEISKENLNGTDYFKIANFINYILYVNEKTKNADGFVYPSVPAQGAGFNVAIKPHIIDNKVEFKASSLCYLAKNKKKSYLMILNRSYSVSNLGKISYKMKEITVEEKEHFEKIANNLNFIN